VSKINEGSVYAPFQIGGTSFDKNKVKLINLVILANFIPNFILRFILKHKFYIFLPAIKVNYTNVILSVALTKIFYPKKYVFSLPRVFIDYLHYYKHYMSKYFHRSIVYNPASSTRINA
jgi:hypothetical protein